MRQWGTSVKGVAVGGWFAAALAVSTPAQETARIDPDAAGLSRARLREATDLLNLNVAEGRIAGAVAAVARRRHVGYLAAIGYQDLAARTPMTARSLFRIYSMTRPVTAVAVMMLHEEGRFGLDDPVARFIPEFGNAVVQEAPGTASRPPARPITVRDLLLHTSGLQPRTSEISQRERVRSRTISMTQFIANLVRVPLMEDPGTRYRYSEGTSVLGRLVEIWSDTPFEVFLEERLFRPLRMTDTVFWADTAEQRARLTTVYGPAADGGLRPIETEALPFTERPALIEGAIGLLSTASDYLRFSQMLLNKGELDGVRILRAATVETITQNGLSDAVVQDRGSAAGWGLANVEVIPGGEYGWDGTAGTIFWIDPDRQTAIVLMTASQPSNPGLIRERFKAAVEQAIITP